MRIVIQRVKRASVSVDDNIVGQINHGLLVLVGVAPDDTHEDIHYLVNKLINMRIFEDEQEKMNLSVKETNGSLLIVSQFTLFANCKKGNRPSFTDAGAPDMSKKLYQEMINICKDNGVVTEQGIFGADMDISLINHGPVTIVMDSKQR